jgi:PAS domain S-box-containing protein
LKKKKIMDMPEPHDDSRSDYSQPAKANASTHTENGHERAPGRELIQKIKELEKANEEIRNARRAALNLMEDALLSKQALQKSESEFRTIANAAPAIVWISKAPSGANTFFNEQWYEYTGQTEKKAGGFGWIEKVHPDDRDRTAPRWKHCTKTGDIYEGEIRYQHKNGGYRWHAFRALSHRNSSNIIEAWYGVSVDVHDRKLAEEAVRQSERRLQMLADAVPQVIWVNESGGKAIYFNRRWFEYTGLNYEQSAGPGWQAVVHTDDAPASGEKWSRALEAGEIFDAEYRLRRYDGIYRWFIGRNVPTRDEAGKITGWFGSATDINDLKQAQEALGRSEARLKITMESAIDYAIITMDTKRRIERWSSGATALFGYTEAEVAGRSADIIFTDEDRQAGVPDKEMETARKAGKATDERWHQRKDGTRFYVSGAMTPIYEDTLTGFVKVAQDVTERKLLEQQKDEFISIASHELKTPVTTIKAYSEFLKEVSEDHGNDEITLLVSKLNIQVDRLTGLVMSLLDTTKISEGQLTLFPEKFNINQLITERIDELQHTTTIHKLVFVPGQDKYVTADKERIGQVLTNLISNGIKYSPKGGNIIITISGTEKCIQVSVKDNGIGIPGELKDRIFERFYRVHTEEISTYPGMGLGLYIAARIIQRHGGKIWAESNPHEGSTFYFSLPAA